MRVMAITSVNCNQTSQKANATTKPQAFGKRTLSDRKKLAYIVRRINLTFRPEKSSKTILDFKGDNDEYLKFYGKDPRLPNTPEFIVVSLSGKKNLQYCGNFRLPSIDTEYVNLYNQLRGFLKNITPEDYKGAFVNTEIKG